MSFPPPRPRPGDLIGFSGADFLSDAINLATFGVPRWGLSHVGIVAEHPEHGIVLYESTTLNRRPCLIHGRPVSGVQCQDLKARVREYKGRVWHYPLRVDIGIGISWALWKLLTDLTNDHCPYDYIGAARARAMLIAALTRWKHGEDIGSIFCSELVAFAWREFDLFETCNASRWNPNALARAARKQKVVTKPVRWK